jgi:XTP/dITP diphosphohydrolase
VSTARFVLATANPDKAKDIEAILAPIADRLELVARPAEVPEVEETGETLEENALLKGRALCKATGLPALADDTGLEVDALGGAPGVYSSRYAGAHASYADNVEKLRQAMSGQQDRRARFTTVAVAVFPDGKELIASGSVGGHIAEAPRGKNGFGYDPLFVPDEGDGRTFAEMSHDEKNSLSHRGRAFRLLAERLAGHLG